MAASSPTAAVRRIKVKPVELTEESWKPYGQLGRPQPDSKEFDSQDAQLNLSRGIPRFYLMRLEGRKSLKFGSITHHAKVTQCLGSMGGHSWYIGVAPASIIQSQPDDPRRHPEPLGDQPTTKCKGAVQAKAGHLYIPPSPEEVRVFRIDGTQFVKLHTGTWHAGPFFKEEAMEFFNLELSNTNVVDHTTHVFEREDGVIFQIDD